MLIRDWKKKDNGAVALLEKECFKFPWTFEMVEETQSQKNFYGAVAEEGEQIIGYVGSIYCFDQADVALVATKPSFRRKNVAQNLINRVIDELLQRGVSTVFLEVRVGNIPARSLYEKMGFKTVGIRKNYYEDAEDAIVMAKVIND